MMRIECDQSQQLGKGAYAIVFHGTLDKTQQVAVKRIQLAGLNTESGKTGEEALLHLNHHNVIKLLHLENDTNFRYYALELCKASLEELYLKGENKYCGPVPELDQMFLQLADGLRYIHDKKLVHRDIKPENVLIWVGNCAYGFQHSLMKWADFGLCKPTNISGSFSMSGVKGTLDWFAPELLKAYENGNIVGMRGTNKSDVFAEGLIFGYILLEGQHPFGTKLLILHNLSQNNPVNLEKITKWHKRLVDELINKQLKPNPEERMTADEVFKYLQEHTSRNTQTCSNLKKESQRAAIVVRQNSRLTSTNMPIDGIDIFQLPLKKHKTSTPGVCHYVFGEPSNFPLVDKRRKRTILMLGATGSGKSTLINAMVNYILGVKWSDDFRFKLIDEPTDKSKAYSQTDLVTMYDLHPMKGSRLGYSLTLVEIPGFGDTRGLEKDKNIIEKIRNYLKSNHGIQQLEAVCFVVQSALPRLTPTQQYIFDSILSIFSQEMKENIRLVVTFSDNSVPPVLAAFKEAKISSPVDPKTGLPLHHKFNNSIFFTSKQSSSEVNEIYENYFDMALEGFDQFFDDLSRMETKSFTLIREVLEERKKLEARAKASLNKRLTKMNQEDYEDSDRESDFTSVSNTTWNTRQSQRQNAKIRTDELFQFTRRTPGNRTKSFVSDHTMTDNDSQINSSQNFDSVTLIGGQPRFAPSILNRCKKIGNRNGMDFYAVRLNESKTGSKQNVVRRFVFGQPGPKQGQHKTILMMGTTGSGKTTLINGMINYIFGVEWDDPFRFHLIEEQLVGQSQANSQTSIITAYDIYYMDGFRIPYSLTIVDTPGYGDTKGIDRDKEITDMVQKLFEDKIGIQELDVIGFVAQASLPRLTPTQIYIFDSVLSIFGNDVRENINFLLTFADSQNPPVLSAINQAGLPCPTDSDGDPLHHKFNNSGFFCSSRPEASSKFDRFFWKMGMDNFQKFFSSLATMKTKSLSLTKQVLDERKKLEATVDGLQPLLKIGLYKMEELRKTNQVISNSQAQIDANQDVKIEVEVTVPKKVEIPAGHYFSNCNKCYVTCHYPCGEDEVNCWAMDLSMPEATRTCRVCPGKCMWNFHVRQPYKWEYVNEMQVTSSDAIKEKYEAEMNKKLTSKELVSLLERDIKENEKEVLAKVDIVASCIKRLDEIALRPNPFSTPQYIDLIINAEEQEKKPGFKERIESLKKLRENAVIFNKVRNNRGERGTLSHFLLIR